MNIYDTKILHCSICGKYVGEIQYDALVVSAKCKSCESSKLKNKKPHVKMDKIMKIKKTMPSLN